MLTFLDYLRETGVEQPLPRPAVEVLDARGPVDLAEPMTTHRAALRIVSFEQLDAIMLARHRWLAWRDRLDQLKVERASKAPLTEALVATTSTPDELDALARGVDEGLPEPLLRLWKDAVALAMAESTVAVEAADEARVEPFRELIGDHGALGSIPNDRWLAIRRGIRDGALVLAIQPPVAKLLERVADPELQPLVLRRSAEGVLGHYVLRPLAEALVSRRNVQADEALTVSAALEYRELLSSQPLSFLPAGAVWVGTDRQRIGLTLADKRGVVTATAPVRPSGDFADRVARWMRDHRAKAVVVPASAPMADWLDAIVATVEDGKTRVIKMSAAGVAEARSADDPVLRRVSPEEASAIVLIRRALHPLEEWNRLDAARLGLAPADVDAARLRDVLQMTRERCLAGAQPAAAAAAMAPAPRTRSSAPMNPMVRGIRDLRPGLTLTGVVTNVTKFGAFVNIGLRQEGLIHISELSDEFVNDPAEVVQAGQQVTARVISVDLERGRIALSLRAEGAAPRMPGPLGEGGPPRPSGPPRGGPPRGGPPRGGPPGSGPGGAERSKALRDLESLFKK